MQIGRNLVTRALHGMDILLEEVDYLLPMQTRFDPAQMAFAAAVTEDHRVRTTRRARMSHGNLFQHYDEHRR
jgi:hypothetical protein